MSDEEITMNIMAEKEGLVYPPTVTALLDIDRVQVNFKDVSNYILSLSDPDDGDLISNLKMQKLLYYVQGFSLVLLNETMFDNEIQHWTHGPVVPEAYHEYKAFGSAGIQLPEEFNLAMFSDKQKEVLNDVYAVYGQYSAWKLRQMTYEESPWLNTKENEVISHGLLKEYFKKQIT